MALKNAIVKANTVLRERGIVEFILKSIKFIQKTVELWLINTIPARRKYIEKTLKDFKSSDIDETVNFIYKKFSSLFKPIQVESELKSLLKIFKVNQPKTVLEIGTANGGTLFCFTKLSPDDAIIISIDLPQSALGEIFHNKTIPISIYKSFAKPNQQLFLLRNDSHSLETLKSLEAILSNRKLDFLFIDGDHSYEGVKKDFEMYGPLVRAGGIIAFHDIVPLQKNYDQKQMDRTKVVSDFWQEIKNQYQVIELVENWNQGWGGIGVIFVEK